MNFIRNLWYVAAWTTEFKETTLARVIIGTPIVIWRDSKGNVVAMDNRCPHRLAPLSRGRVDGDTIQCMYHGMRYSKEGQCVSVQGTDIIPPKSTVRTYPAVEKNDWIWVWMGEPELADPDTIPNAYGLDTDEYVMIEGAIDYDAHYELVNDNLTDLSHLDFVHETTLGATTGQVWSNSTYDIQPVEGGLRLQRWLNEMRDDVDKDPSETWNTYYYLLPGLFIMRIEIYPPGTAEKCNFEPPSQHGFEPVYVGIEQQAVTPISETQTRYQYATGTLRTPGLTREILDERLKVIKATFEEDRQMIEAQQKMWDLSDDHHPKAFIPYDKAPNMFRKMIQRKLAEEAAD